MPVIPHHGSSLDASKPLQHPNSPHRHFSKSRLSLTSLIQPSRLLRRLSSAPHSILATSGDHGATKSESQQGSARAAEVRADSGTARRGMRRSSTLPIIPAEADWEVVHHIHGQLWSEPVSLDSSEGPESFNSAHPLLSEELGINGPHLAMASHGPAGGNDAGVSTATPTSCATVKSIAASGPRSAPPTPAICQRVWLCTPPKPSQHSQTAPTAPAGTASPYASSHGTMRAGSVQRLRPQVTTRAMSTGRLAREFDEDGTVVCLSVHSERVLDTRQVAKGWSCWREKYACCPGAKEGKGGREVLARAISAGPAAGAGRLGREERAVKWSELESYPETKGRSRAAPRESGSREPLLQE